MSWTLQCQYIVSMMCYLYVSQEQYAYDEYFNRTTFGILEGTITREQLIVLLRHRVRLQSVNGEI